MVTIYKATEWYSKGNSEKFTCVIKTWTDRDLEIIFVKQFCIEEEKSNLKKKKSYTVNFSSQTCLKVFSITSSIQAYSLGQNQANAMW